MRGVRRRRPVPRGRSAPRPRYCAPRPSGFTGNPQGSTARSVTSRPRSPTTGRGVTRIDTVSSTWTPQASTARSVNSRTSSNSTAGATNSTSAPTPDRSTGTPPVCRQATDSRSSSGSDAVPSRRTRSPASPVRSAPASTVGKRFGSATTTVRPSLASPPQSSVTVNVSSTAPPAHGSTSGRVYTGWSTVADGSKAPPAPPSSHT